MLSLMSIPFRGSVCSLLFVALLFTLQSFQLAATVLEDYIVKTEHLLVGADAPVAQAVDNTYKNAYFITGRWPFRVVAVRLSDLKILGSVTLPGNITATPSAAVFDVITGFFFFVVFFINRWHFEAL